MLSADRVVKLGEGMMETFTGSTLVSALVGVGVGWLIATGTNGSHKAAIEKISDILENKDNPKKKMEEYAESAKEYAQDVGEQIQNWAKDFGVCTQKQYKRACKGAKELAEKRPGTLAAASLAAAALVGVGVWQLLREKE